MLLPCVCACASLSCCCMMGPSGCSVWGQKSEVIAGVRAANECLLTGRDWELLNVTATFLGCPLYPFYMPQAHGPHLDEQEGPDQAQSSVWPGNKSLTHTMGPTLLFSCFRSEMLQNLKPGRLSVLLRAMPTL